jgi:NTP pyrophosphatase (non-canonical NTP hydrolase)
MNDNVSFGKLQSFIKKCYGVVNDRNYSNVQLASKIQRYATISTKKIRQQRNREIGSNLAMTLAWTVALANRLAIELDTPKGGEIWQRYPLVCPYCNEAPCACSGTRSKERIVDMSHKPSTLEKPTNLRSVYSYQQMFKRIYPNNKAMDTCQHLLEEVSELEEAVQIHNSTHKLSAFEDILDELVDVVANLCGVASTHHLELGLEVARLFRGECCVKCNKPVCECGYTVATPVQLS